MGVVLGRFVDRSHYDCEHTFSAVDEPVHPSTVALIAYWRQCQAHGGMRMGRDIPARAIAALMKDLVVAEPVGDWDDAHLRLVGSGMAAHFGRDVTGSRMREVMTDEEKHGDMLLTGVKVAIAHNRPVTAEHIILDKGRTMLRQEMTALPLRAPAGDECWALIATFNF